MLRIYKIISLRLNKIIKNSYITYYNKKKLRANNVIFKEHPNTCLFLFISTYVRSQISLSPVS